MTAEQRAAAKQTNLQVFQSFSLVDLHLSLLLREGVRDLVLGLQDLSLQPELHVVTRVRVLRAEVQGIVAGFLLLRHVEFLQDAGLQLPELFREDLFARLGAKQKS